MRVRLCVRAVRTDGKFPAIVLSIPSPVARDRALVGCKVMVVTKTVFVRVARNMVVEVEASDAALDQLFAAMVDEQPLSITSDIHPCSEPSVRVPLSLLKELRGQEREAEQQRQVLLTVRD